MSDSFVKVAIRELHPHISSDRIKSEEAINIGLLKARQIASEIEDQRRILEELEIAESRLRVQVKNIEYEVCKVMLGGEFQKLLSQISEQMKDSIVVALGPFYTRGDGEVLVTAVIQDIIAKSLTSLGKEQEDL